MTPIERAAAHVGGMSALAEKVGVSQSAPSMWKARGSVPVEHCLAIERATDGLVKRVDLRPADYWRIWPDLPEPEATQATEGAA